jgi:hypothetical protein
MLFARTRDDEDSALLKMLGIFDVVRASYQLPLGVIVVESRRDLLQFVPALDDVVLGPKTATRFVSCQLGELRSIIRNELE